MYQCYRVQPRHLRTLQPLVDHTIELDAWDYFLEYDAASLTKATGVVQQNAAAVPL